MGSMVGGDLVETWLVVWEHGRLQRDCVEILVVAEQLRAGYGACGNCHELEQLLAVAWELEGHRKLAGNVGKLLMGTWYIEGHA